VCVCVCVCVCVWRLKKKGGLLRFYSLFFVLIFGKFVLSATLA
jgi:hypothetical protein